MYQQTRLSDGSAIGAPGDLPYVVANWSDTELGDLDAMKLDPQFGLKDMGFWPVVVSAPTFDAAKQVLSDGISGLTVDATNKRWTATTAVRSLTSTELAAALGAAQSAKEAELTAACVAQIVGGYQSSALGTAHTYPSKPTDQTNMLGSVLDSVLPNLPANWTTPFWVADSAGVWGFVQHTAAQIQQAGSDGKAAVASAQLRLASLNSEIASATTVDQVNAIVW